MHVLQFTHNFFCILMGIMVNWLLLSISSLYSWKPSLCQPKSSQAANFMKNRVQNPLRKRYEKIRTPFFKTWRGEKNSINNNFLMECLFFEAMPPNEWITSCSVPSYHFCNAEPINVSSITHNSKWTDVYLKLSQAGPK